jgi:hypothetical protein
MHEGRLIQTNPQSETKLTDRQLMSSEALPDATSRHEHEHELELRRSIGISISISILA